MASINFLPKKGNGRMLQISVPQSTAEVGVKLTRLVLQHEQVKVAYRQLKSHIKTGLAEVEQVFVSLAILLMKLVSLKTEEMAQEAKLTTIFIDFELSQGGRSNSGACDQSGIISYSRRR